MSQLIIPTLWKYAAEIIDYVADFSKFPEAIAEDTLTSCVVPAVTSPDAILSTGTAAISAEDIETIPAGSGVVCRISGGTAGQTYLVYFRGTFNTGAVRQRAMYLAIY
jgi:hypothetical protein